MSGVDQRLVRGVYTEHRASLRRERSRLLIHPDVAEFTRWLIASYPTVFAARLSDPGCNPTGHRGAPPAPCPRSEEHTSELQSLRHLVCRLLLEKKKKQ